VAFSSAVKSLRPDELKGSVVGSGTGEAKAAELNGYPGPKHLLEQRDELRLIKTRVTTLERLAEQMATEKKSRTKSIAQTVGNRVVIKSRRRGIAEDRLG